ncbi:hypothetical protein niasHS_004274 [Heterodera schachtii]|uniref:SXP/RAL-2 family protein Ani s 5-like cation-binding domain-containing protein n=1 Tax=Heterodera schachtii TaxID=97005 RepID=A0ABD2JKK3_HETSC
MLSLLPILPIVLAAFVAPFANAVFSTPSVTLSLNPKEIELLMDTAQKYKNLSDDQQVAAFQTLAEEQGGDLKANIDNVLMKVKVSDDQFKQNIEEAKQKLSSSKAKESADQLEDLFLDGSLPFIDKVKKSVEMVQELPEKIRKECQPVLQVINSITRCPFKEQCTPSEEIGGGNIGNIGEQGGGGGGGIGLQHGQNKQGQMGETVPKSGQEESKQGQQQQQQNQQEQPCFHLKLLKVCTISKNQNQ